MKYLVVLGDGMADRPVAKLRGRTPLDVAYKPNIDYLAAHGQLGSILTVPENMPAGSDVANLSVLGYDPEKYYSGRSPLEAASIGLPLVDSDTTFRANLVTLSDETDYASKTMVDYSSDEVTSDEAAILIEALNASLKDDALSLHAGVSYRNILLHKNFKDNPSLTPPHDISGKRIGNYLPTDDLLLQIMQKSYDILINHEVNAARRERGLRAANSLWLWGQGKKPHLSPFTEKYGLKGSIISAVDLLKGIGKCADMLCPFVEGATGNIHTNYDGKVQAAIDAFRNGCDFVYLHVEAPDECGHRFEVENKVRSIELIDEKIVAPLFAWLQENEGAFKILILPDHATPVELGTHTHDHVPFLIYDNRNTAKSSQRYTERDAKVLFEGAGHTLMDRFLE